MASLLVTGGSGGIGLALASSFVKRHKSAHVAITGRDEGKLADARRKLLSDGAAAVTARAIDVTDSEAMAAFVKEVHDAAPLTCVVCNAGVAAPTLGEKAGVVEELANARRILDTNVLGVLNTALPALPLLRPRQGTQIIIVASLGALGTHLPAGCGHYGLRGALVYLASKAAIDVLAQGLRAELRAGAPKAPPWVKGANEPSAEDAAAAAAEVETPKPKEEVSVSVVYPPFVATSMTRDNHSAFSRGMPAERAGDIIVRGIDERRKFIAFPTWQVFGLRVMNATPLCCLAWCAK